MKKFISFLFIFTLFGLSVNAKDLRFVQITDVRYSKQNNPENLAKVIKDVNKQKNVDFVVFTGDNIERVDKTNLEDFIKAAKKLKRPFYVIIGDRDVNKHKDLGKKEYAAYLKKNLPNYKTTDINYIFERNGVIFFVVDGAKDVIPSTNGYFKDNVVEWVDANIDLYPKKNIVILQHFPLIPPEENENYTTFKAKNYLDILEKHKNVKAVISGHFGVNKEENVNGIEHITTAPAPTYRIIDMLDCTSPNPTFWAEVREVK